LACSAPTSSAQSRRQPSAGTAEGANVYSQFDLLSPNTFQNSIIAGGHGGSDCVLEEPGAAESLGNNLFSDTSCGPPAEGDVTGTNPGLQPLADNGGSTPTRALSLDSPAVDAGASDGLKDDQRGQPRPSDSTQAKAPAAAKDKADIGAYELQLPNTILKKKPIIKRPKKSILRFKSTIPHSKFTCKLDGGKAKSCKRPQNYRFLEKGKHRFSVYATSPEGFDDPTPAKATWFVHKGPRPPGQK